MSPRHRRPLDATAARRERDVRGAGRAGPVKAPSARGGDSTKGADYGKRLLRSRLEG
ncbi:hypothetical protein O1Q96_16405 [Streptomyces sp. Qhu-G9]|uniref:hypothetical protein n=1 Tax=Streptomyces sp. Qhu-G9 TaxID=3452799 RepID=UPI0022ABD95E|nr:hypothetical protein [Streptomyces aurantiacus]WAU81218.1 hypothetical protein O1Q96_16405 [Streptomyces aurantiacus]